MTQFMSTHVKTKNLCDGRIWQNQSLPMREQGMSLSDVLGESLGINSLSASRGKIYVVRSDK